MAELSKKKLDKIIFTYKKYHFGCTDDDIMKVEDLVRWIFRYSRNEQVAMKIINGLRRGHIFNIDDLLIADMDNISQIRGFGLVSLNVIRKIKGLPVKTYEEEHPFSKKIPGARRKLEIIEKLHKLGYVYGTSLFDDGTICTHRFIRPDCMRFSNSCYWEVAVEDHTEDDGKDWLIFVRYHDPDEKDWLGKQIDTSGCVEFEVMKLIVEFTEILKKGE